MKVKLYTNNYICFIKTVSKLFNCKQRYLEINYRCNQTQLVIRVINCAVYTDLQRRVGDTGHKLTKQQKSMTE
jgi:hypothetical protein